MEFDTDRQASTAYNTLGTLIQPLTNNTGNYVYMVSIAGTSGGSTPSPWTQTSGGLQTDGAVTWLNTGKKGLPLNTTIASFVSSTQVTLAASATIFGNSLVIKWATDDTVAIQAAINLMQSAGQTGLGLIAKGANRVMLPSGSGAIITNTLLFDRAPGDFGSWGWGRPYAAFNSTGSPVGASIAWGGQTPNLPMIKVLNTIGLHLHDLELVGNSAAMPSACIELNDDTTTRVIPEVNNHFERIVCGASGGAVSSANSPDPNQQFTSDIVFTPVNANGNNNGPNEFDDLFLKAYTTYAIDDPEILYEGEQFNTLQILATGAAIGGAMIRDAARYIQFVNFIGLSSPAPVFEFPVGETRTACIGCNFQLDAAFMKCDTSADVDIGFYSGMWRSSTAIDSFTTPGLIADCAVAGDHRATFQDFEFITDSAVVSTPLIRWKDDGSYLSQNALLFNNVKGISRKNLDVVPGTGINTNTIDFVATKANSADSAGGATQDGRQILTTGDSLNMFATDIRGGLRDFGGELTVLQATAPTIVSCTVVGGGSSHTYVYELTAVSCTSSGAVSGETTISSTVTCSSQADPLNSTNTNTALWRPNSRGACGIRAYRQKDGLAFARLTADTKAADQFNSTNQALDASVIQLVDDGSLTWGGTAPPTVNATGGSVLNGRVTLGSGALLASTGGSAPSVSTCGTSASAAGTNTKPIITVGSTNPTTSCVLTFATGTPFSSAPTCQFQDITKGVGLTQSSLSATGVTVGAPSGVTDLHGDTINGWCVQ